MSKEDVQNIVLKPMLALYPPPHHLRQDAIARQEALEAYRIALERFEKPTLAAAWEQVVADHAFWVWPNPGDLVAACRQQAVRSRAGEGQGKLLDQAQAKADTYVRQYLRTSKLAQLARKEGWQPLLMQYVREAAFVQARLIEGVRVQGYDAGVLFGYPHHELAEKPWKEQVADFFARASEQAQRGHIRVAVPPRLIAWWKGRSGPEREQAPQR